MLFLEAIKLVLVALSLLLGLDQVPFESSISGLHFLQQNLVVVGLLL